MKSFNLGWISALWLGFGLLSAQGDETLPPQAKYAVEPQFRLLRFGEVKPTGWILEQMQRDLASGFAGHMPELAVRTAGNDVFGKDRRRPHSFSDAARPGDLEWYDGETQGNWRSGNTMMTLLAGTPEQRAALDARVMELLKKQDADGYMGVYAPEMRWGSGQKCGELWTQTCLFRGLIAYGEATGKTEVLKAVERAVQLTISNYMEGTKPLPQGQHTLMFLDVVERLYDLTGNAVYKDFGLYLCKDGFKTGRGFATDILLEKFLNAKQLFCGHGPTSMESLRLPFWSAYAGGGPVRPESLDFIFKKLEPQLSPAGGMVACEWMSGKNGPGKPAIFMPDKTGYESCSVKEWMTSLLSGAQKTGKISFADRAETAFLNAVQATRLPNGKAVTYCTKDNIYTLNGRPRRYKFSPCHEDGANCCGPNHTQVASIFVRNMWMRSNDGLAAVLYGPCNVETTVNGVFVKIIEQTGYPFENVVVVSIQPRKPSVFTVRFRLPEWSAKSDVTCEGASINQNDGWVLVRKEWTAGDRIRLSFGAKLQLIQANNGEFYLRHGPLFYVFPVPTVFTPTKKRYAIPGFHDLLATPAAGAKWDYALPEGSGTQNPPKFTLVAFETSDARYPWDTAALKLKGSMVKQDSGEAVGIELAPMGSGPAKLRRCTFPPFKPLEKDKSVTRHKD